MVEDTTMNVINKLDQILNLMERIPAKIKSNKPKLYSQELIEIIFQLPCPKRRNLIEQKLGTPKTVGNYLMKLEKIGILKSKKVGKEKLYINHELMKILE